MKKSVILFLVLAKFGFCFSQTSYKSVYLKHVTIIDVVNGKRLPGMTVVIADSMITQVGSSKEINISRKAKVINCKGKYLIPGLWDMHVHLGNATGSSLPVFIANGITGVRDMGTKSFDSIQTWKRQITTGLMMGPRIISSGPILNGGSNLPDFQIAVNSAAEAVRMVDSLVKIGVDFIKVHGGLSRETYFAIANESKRLKIPFAGHVPASSMAVLISGEEASEAGQSSLEHMLGIPFTRDTIQAFQNMYPTEESLKHLFEILLKNKTFVTPTLSVYNIPPDYLNISEKQKTLLKYISPALISFWKSQIGDWPKRDKTFMRWLLKTRMNMIPHLRDAGIPLMAGTDTGFPFVLPGFGLHQELKLLNDAGLSSLEVIETATINPAIFMGKQSQLGSVEIGKIADLILLNADPTLNIENLQKIEAVFSNGKYYDRIYLDNQLSQVAEQVKSAK